MIEIIFSDSACGSLKAAQHYGERQYQDEEIGVFVSHRDGSKPTKEEIASAQREVREKLHLAWDSAIPMGGNTADIYGFSLMLSVGDISEAQPGVKRKQTLEHLYSAYPDNEGHQAAQKVFQEANKNLKTVCERAKAGSPIRIWYSNRPDEMCGLYWFMEQLNQWEVSSQQVSIVDLPKWEVDKNGNIVRKSGWCEMAPEEWYRYLPLQRPVQPVFQQSCASRWKELQRENTPLRAILNGQLISTSETLYDDFIFREIAAEDEIFQEAMIVGRVLGKYQLGIGDSWVAYRIEEMIHAGKLEIVTAADKDIELSPI